MSRYLRYTIEQKIRACEDYLSDAQSVSEICVSLGMSPKSTMTIYRWLDKYKIWGADVFIPSSKNKSYTKEFKLRAVEEYISGQASVREIVAKYNIGSDSMLERWISLYNANRELKDYDLKGRSIWQKLEEKQQLKNVGRLLNIVLNITVIIKAQQVCMMFHTIRFIPG